MVGIGPGSYEEMTVRAVRAMEESQVVVGYTVYADLMREHFPGKEWITTPMRQETERCRMALDRAKGGETAALICSGDAGVYGMSGLVLELMGEDIRKAAKRQKESGGGREKALEQLSVKMPEKLSVKMPEIQVVPGVTAALSGGALLGAPLGHDFAVISLSDLLTPLELIEKRLIHAAMADFAICLYNPSSHKRAGYLKWACEILLKHKSPQTVCGIVTNVARKGETMELKTLLELKDAVTDMFTTVFVGNERTKAISGRMVTPRGYRDV